MLAQLEGTILGVCPEVSVPARPPVTLSGLFCINRWALFLSFLPPFRFEALRQFYCSLREYSCKSQRLRGPGEESRPCHALSSPRRLASHGTVGGSDPEASPHESVFEAQIEGRESSESRLFRFLCRRPLLWCILWPRRDIRKLGRKKIRGLPLLLVRANLFAEGTWNKP